MAFTHEDAQKVGEIGTDRQVSAWRLVKPERRGILYTYRIEGSQLTGATYTHCFSHPLSKENRTADGTRRRCAGVVGEKCESRSGAEKDRRTNGRTYSTREMQENNISIVPPLFPLFTPVAAVAAVGPALGNLNRQATTLVRSGRAPR